VIALLWLACGNPGVAVVDREVSAACGTCVFGMQDAKGCFWAVEIDGTFHAVGGVKPPDDMVTAHGEDGMCSVERRAVVSGSIRPDGRFLATEFELLPWDGTGRRAAPHPH
jgi:hypothetical protein